MQFQPIRWEITSKPTGSSADLSDPNLPNPTMTLDKEGTYVLSLVVTDSRGAASAPDEVIISTLNSKPTADAGPDQVITFLNGEIFHTLKEAQILIERWRREYNTVRPHSALGYRPPAPEAIHGMPRDPGYAMLRQDLWLDLTPILT